MATFKELMSQLKGTLKDNLSESNLELFTKIDKGLDELSESHTKTEEDLSSMKDRLIEVVKTGYFKDDSKELDPTEDTNKPIDIDSALNDAIAEAIANRK